MWGLLHEKVPKFPFINFVPNEFLSYWVWCIKDWQIYSVDAKDLSFYKESPLMYDITATQISCSSCTDIQVNCLVYTCTVETGASLASGEV